MPVARYASPDEQYRLVNDMLNKFLASATDFERSHLKALEWSINEITDNVLVHSQSPDGRIHLISSSFADEVFGKLFLELGPLDFSNKIELKNLDGTVKLLIDKAIIQRMNSN